MKNVFLSYLSFFDRLYPLVSKLPRFIQKIIAEKLSLRLGHRLKTGVFPGRLTMFVTDRCNLQCPHCFIIGPNHQKANWEMGINEYEKFFRKARGRISQIMFTGGEPSLRSDLGQIITLAHKAGAVPWATVFSNGILDKRLLDTVEYVFSNCGIKLSFQFSIDGSQVFHDLNRGIDGALEKTLRTMAAIRELKTRVPGRIGRLAACTAISKRNFAELPSIIEAVRDTGYLHAFTFVRSSDTGVFNLKSREELSDFSPTNFDGYLSIEEMDEALRLLHEYLWDRFPDSLYYATNRVVLETIANNLKEGKPRSSCSSGLSDLVILSNGDVARCEMLRSCANLKEYDWDLAKLVSSGVFLDNYRKTLGCWCTHDCSIAVSIMYNNKLLEDLFKRSGT